jgi:hypothetical protein
MTLLYPVSEIMSSFRNAERGPCPMEQDMFLQLQKDCSATWLGGSMALGKRKTWECAGSQVKGNTHAMQRPYFVHAIPMLFPCHAVPR